MGLKGTMDSPFSKGSETCPEWAARCGGIRGSSVSSPLNPSTPPRRRGVKIFDFAVAVAFGDLEAQRASNLSPLKRPLRGLAAPGAGPPPQRSAKGWLNLPAKRGKTEEKALIQRALRFS